MAFRCLLHITANASQLFYVVLFCRRKTTSECEQTNAHRTRLPYTANVLRIELNSMQKMVFDCRVFALAPHTTKRWTTQWDHRQWAKWIKIPCRRRWLHGHFLTFSSHIEAWENTRIVYAWIACEFVYVCMHEGNLWDHTSAQVKGTEIFRCDSIVRCSIASPHSTNVVVVDCWPQSQRHAHFRVWNRLIEIVAWRGWSSTQRRHTNTLQFSSELGQDGICCC